MRTSHKLLCLGAAGVGGWLALRALRTFTGFDFRDRTVLVTGGTRGLGLVIARQLAGQGAKLVLCARDAEEVDRAREELSQRGTQVLAEPCDIVDFDGVRALVERASNRFGRIDVLINNAGTIAAGPLTTMARADFLEAMDNNYWGSVHTILSVLPDMLKRGEGRIVNITSIGGKVSVPHLVPYCASKFALVGLSEGMRAELAQYGIVVTTICPGLMRTGSPRNADFKGQHRAEYAWFTISDSLPGASISAERAAAEILAACRRGDSEVVLGVAAKLATLVHGIFPGLTSDMLSLVNRLLPGPGGIGSARAKGKESESAWAPSILTRTTDAPALRNNEVSPVER